MLCYDKKNIQYFPDCVFGESEGGLSLKKAAFGLLAVLAVILLTGCTSSEELTAIQEQIASQAVELEDLSGLVDKVESLSGLGEQVAALSEAGTAVETLQQTVAAQETRIAALEEKLAAAEERLAALEGTGDGEDGETSPEEYVPSLLP